MRWVGLELLPQLRHVQAQITGVGDDILARPRSPEECLAREERPGLPARNSSTRRSVGVMSTLGPRGSQTSRKVDSDIPETRRPVAPVRSPERGGHGAKSREKLRRSGTVRDIVVGAGIQGLDFVGPLRLGPTTMIGTDVQPRSAAMTCTPSSHGIPSPAARCRVGLRGEGDSLRAVPARPRPHTRARQGSSAARARAAGRRRRRGSSWGRASWSSRQEWRPRPRAAR